jgi:uracil-DNA glycosylase
MGTLVQNSALNYFPAHLDYDSLREAAEHCKGCDLYRLGTQTVFGEGPVSTPVMMVGEQPGDEEDKQGHPFVGPAGRLLDKALADAGIDRSGVYMTNAVKHFKWKPAGKRRLHQKPNAGEIGACKPWLWSEIEVIRPDII